MVNAEARILAALLIGPMTRRQIATALHRSPTWADNGVRSLIRQHHLIRIATPTFTGKLTWRYALTQRGTQAAYRGIES